MTIEKSPPSTEPKQAAASDTKASKAKAGTPGANDAGAPGGFMAILSAVDTSGASALVQDAEQDPLASAAQAAALAALAQQTDGTGAAMGAAAGNGTPAVATPFDGAALLAQTLQMLPAQPTAVAELARADAAADTPLAIQGNAWARSAQASANSAAANGALAQGAASADDHATAVARKPGAAAKLQADAFDASQAAASADTTLQAPSGISAAVQERTSALAQKAQASPGAAMATPALVAIAAHALRREGEGQERSVFKARATEAAAVPTFTSQATPQLATANAVGAPAPVQAYLTEQVKYWISNDVKNAEMKLEGIGHELVEVSISMHGNAAHVAFRTDELQARSALENAASHLKDMLAREGVMLSGVSVGTAGTQNSDTPQSRARQNGARQASVVSGAVAPVGAAALARSGGVSGGAYGGAVGRALDLFV